MEAQTKFFQESPDYHGVLSTSVDGASRLVVSPNGKRYALQRSVNRGEAFVVVKWRKSLALLQADFAAFDGLPIPSGLPDDPAEVARPWADAMAFASDRLKALVPTSDTFGGVIVSSDGARLVCVASGHYQLQSHVGGGWSSVWSGASRAALLRVLASGFVAGHRLRPFGGNAALYDAALTLPEDAADCPARPRETIAQAVSGFERGGVASDPLSRSVAPSGGAARRSRSVRLNP